LLSFCWLGFECSDNRHLAMVGALPAFNPHTKELHFQGFSDLCRNFRTEVLERWKSESKRVLGTAFDGFSSNKLNTY
jgi:hypothetical protein